MSALPGVVLLHGLCRQDMISMKKKTAVQFIPFLPLRLNWSWHLPYQDHILLPF